MPTIVVHLQRVAEAADMANIHAVVLKEEMEDLVHSTESSSEEEAVAVTEEEAVETLHSVRIAVTVT